MGEAGKARIIFVTQERSTNSIPVIAIPHLHPGFIARTRQPNAQHRVVWLSWVCTWVYLDAAVKTLDELRPKPDRLLLSELVQKRAEHVLNKAGRHEAKMPCQQPGAQAV